MFTIRPPQNEMGEFQMYFAPGLSAQETDDQAPVYRWYKFCNDEVASTYVESRKKNRILLPMPEPETLLSKAGALCVIRRYM